jgi:hypothetical protein
MIHTDLKYLRQNPLGLSIYTFLKKGRRQNSSFPGVGTSERWAGKRKGGMRVNMVDIFCIYI